MRYDRHSTVSKSFYPLGPITPFVSLTRPNFQYFSPSRIILRIEQISISQTSTMANCNEDLILKLVDPGSLASTIDAENEDPLPYAIPGSLPRDTSEQFLPEILPHRYAVIAVMGLTGTGKSTFINKQACK